MASKFHLSESIKIDYQLFDDLNKFMVSLPNEEISQTGKIYFVGCHAPWLKKGWCFCSKYRLGIQRFILIIKNEQTKQDRHLDETNEKSDNYCK